MGLQGEVPDALVFSEVDTDVAAVAIVCQYVKARASVSIEREKDGLLVVGEVDSELFMSMAQL